MIAGPELARNASRRQVLAVLRIRKQEQKNDINRLTVDGVALREFGENAIRQHVYNQAGFARQLLQDLLLVEGDEVHRDVGRREDRNFMAGDAIEWSV